MMAGAGDWAPGWPALLPLAGFALTLALGIFVWSRRGNAALQRSFAALNIAVALWNLDVFLLFSLRDGGVAARVDRFLQAPIIFMPTLAMLFFFIFLGRRRSHPILVGFAVWAGAIVVISTGTSYLSDWKRHWFGWYGTPGRLYPMFVAYVLAYLVVSSVLLAREARATRDRRRRAQALGLLSANLVLGLTSLTNFLPLWGMPFLPLGNIASAAYVYVMAVTIARHGLLDVQVLFRAGMLYSALTFLLSAVYFAAVLGLQRWFQDAVFAGSLLLPMLPALAVGVAAGPLKASLQERLDRTFFRSRAEMRSRLAAFAAVLRGLECEEEIWRAAWAQGWRHAHPAGGVVIRRTDGGSFVAAGEAPPDGDTSAAERMLGGSAGPTRLPPGGPYEIAVPVQGRDGLLGGCLLGPKESGEVWSAEDLQFADVVASHTALAVEQARLLERIGRQERLAAVGRMAAVLSHQLRNPLSVITGAAAVLRRYVEGGPGAPMLQVIRAEVDRSDRFIRELLQGCGEQSFHPVPIDLSLCLREFADGWACAGSAESTLVLDALAEGLWIRGDSFRLRQVFENLARNAAEAGKGSAKIEVRVERPPEGGIAVVFADEGPGIKPEILPVIFEPFRTTKEFGTGLGLSIAKEVIDGHGGRISAANRPGGGALFRIWLPACDPPETNGHGAGGDPD